MLNYLNLAERNRLNELRRTQPFVDEVLFQLDRILQHETFTRAHLTTRNFLEFLVSKSLIGQSDQIKEMTIAIRVFGESAEFEPLINSKVRVAALALRRRIAAYYTRVGARDQIEIVMAPGTYIPIIRYRTPRRRQHGP
jgi:hypothetical protein